MRKFFALVIALVLVLSLSACDINIEDRFTTYTATFTVYIGNPVTDTPSISSNDLAAHPRLTAVYINTFKSDQVLEQVIAESSISLTTSQLREMLSVEPVEDTEILRISVVADDSRLARDLAQTIAEIAPEALSSIFVDSSVTIIDAPTVTANTSLWNLFR